MNKKLFILAAVLSIFLITGVASAQDRFAKGIHKQQNAINRGVRDGSLTPGESEIVQGNLDHIKQTYERATADGSFNKKEARRLDRMLEENGQMIRQKKHNARRLY